MKTLIVILSALLVLAPLVYPTALDARTWYITPDGTGDAPTIQAGVDSAAAGDTVLVGIGTYYENINYYGKNIAVASNYLTTQDTTYISNTIIDGNWEGSVVIFTNEETNESLLCGLTLTHGAGTSPVGIGVYGGGVYCYASDPTLRNLIIIDNQALNYEWGAAGGGIACKYSSPILDRLKIVYNESNSGAGIDCSASNPAIINCIIMYNEVHISGAGGIDISSSSPHIVNNVIKNNYGAGIRCYNSDLEISGNIITDNVGGGIFSTRTDLQCNGDIVARNTSNGRGGGIFFGNQGQLVLINVTITDNYTYSPPPHQGGGIFLQDNCHAVMVNTIAWDNVPDEISFYNDLIPCSVAVAFSDLTGGEEGIETNDNGWVDWLEGNINTDPLFQDAGAGDYRLTIGSPCIDAGTAYFEYDGAVIVDLSPEEYEGSAPDMGAFEFIPDISSVNDGENILPHQALYQNYPNPFNPATTIQFTVTRVQFVSLTIYDINGRLVLTLLNEQLPPGPHSVTWNGTDEQGRPVASGTYIYRLEAGEYVESRRMVLVR